MRKSYINYFMPSVVSQNRKEVKKMQKSPEQIGEMIGRMLAHPTTPASEFKKLADEIFPLVQENEEKWAGVYQLALMSAGMRVRV